MKQLNLEEMFISLKTWFTAKNEGQFHTDVEPKKENDVHFCYTNGGFTQILSSQKFNFEVIVNRDFFKAENHISITKGSLSDIEQCFENVFGIKELEAYLSDIAPAHKKNLVA